MNNEYNEFLVKENLDSAVALRLETELLAAIKSATPEKVSQLLKDGANPNGNSYPFPLDHVVIDCGTYGDGWKSNKPEECNNILKLLLDAKANPEIADGKPLLAEAALLGRILLVNTLLTHGVDSNRIDPYYKISALHNAACSQEYSDLESSKTIIKSLLKHGANKRLQDNEHKTPYDYAVKCNNSAAMKLLTKDCFSEITDYLCNNMPGALKDFFCAETSQEF